MISSIHQPAVGDVGEAIVSDSASRKQVGQAEAEVGSAGGGEGRKTMQCRAVTTSLDIALSRRHLSFFQFLFFSFSFFFQFLFFFL